MILIGLVVLIAVLMALAVPHLWRKLTAHDAGRRAGITVAPGTGAVTP